MKTYVYAIAFFIIALGSCKKDRIDPAIATRQSMTGKWIYDKFTYQEIGLNGKPDGSIMDFDQDDQLATMEFKSDGSRLTTSDGQEYTADNWQAVDGQSFMLQPLNHIVLISSLTPSAFVYTIELPKDQDYHKLYTIYLKK